MTLLLGFLVVLSLILRTTSLFERYFGANELSHFLSSATEQIPPEKVARLCRHLSYDWGIYSVANLHQRATNDRSFLSEQIGVRLDWDDVEKILFELKNSAARRPRNIPLYEKLILAISPLEFLVTVCVLVLGLVFLSSGEGVRRMESQQSPTAGSPPPETQRQRQQQREEQKPSSPPLPPLPPPPLPLPPQEQEVHVAASSHAPPPPTQPSGNCGGDINNKESPPSPPEEYNFYKLMSQFDKKGSPAKKSKVVVLHSSTEWNTNTNKMVDIFARKKFNVVMVDGTLPESKELRDVLFLVSGARGKYPQCFLSRSRGHFEFVGTWDAIGDLLENESLPEKFLREHPEINTFSSTFSNIEALD